ncbi:C6 transcription factor, putative [Talaromyces stipitatus ATCC 10500]|uniref:C6 transcription factor, putative n=1 Tax=Talaromyces stipitatus (strain ATCC 10500 / CBS 375.48 / QM 6759 / NRRL 1006) TaxID=441959 RepID=B8LVV4_TALSN|nr:C6 transcription factor, putative [Talaromyces stipitatus ATCC 10500]EED24320.1 C6 transcription factor, putative [Talaromyces stipitatus ATCC 10500]
MPSSSFLDHPVLKVSRPVAACLRCRTAKIKCDGKLPSCSACEKAGKANTCSGATDEFAKGKERSYVASLEGYCEKLEKRLAEMRRLKEAQGSNISSGQEVPQSSITAFAAENSSSRAHRKEVRDIDDLVGDFGFLSVNATSRDFHGITSNVSFAQLLWTLSTVKLLPQLSPRSLPSRQEATSLIQYYFDNILIQLPLFTETTFWTSVEAVYQNGGRFAKPIDQWMVYMVLAIASASLWHQQPSVNRQFALSMVSAAMPLAGEVLQPGSSLGVKAILLLAQYSLFDPEHFSPRFLVFFAARVMIDLGLHQDPPREVVFDRERLEQRRRLFYALYTMDRIVCTSLGHTFSFSDHSVDVDLPAVRALPGNSPDENVFMKRLDCAIHMIKIRRILSKGYQQMYFDGRDPVPHALARTWKLCAEAREWYANAPTTTTTSFGLLYRLELLYCTIVFLSPSFGDPDICDFSRVVLFDRCIDYISQLHQVLEQPGSLPFMTFVEIRRAYQIGDRLVNLLDESYDLLLSNELPKPPAVPSGTPDPPYLAVEDRINCRPRAARCLEYIIDILHYGCTRWNMRGELDSFARDSTIVKQRLSPDAGSSSQPSSQMPLYTYVSQGVISTDAESVLQPYPNPGSTYH